RPLISIFFGGGTPSLFSGGAIARLLAGIRERLPLAADAEITLEANPGTAEAEHFAAYRAAGVNRLSLGVQSFRDEQLRALGRVHNAAGAERAFELARAAGFDNINLDLMYALPGERDAAGALNDLRRAIDFAPEHLSWYQLTMEPGTAFHRRPRALRALRGVGPRARGTRLAAQSQLLAIRRLSRHRRRRTRQAHHCRQRRHPPGEAAQPARLHARRGDSRGGHGGNHRRSRSDHRRVHAVRP